MGVRREGREAAVQLLYSRDINPGANADEICATFWRIRNARDAIRHFCEKLARGVMEHLPEIDALLAKHCHNYELNRLSAVDRNILRLAVYELNYCPDVPAAVIINEAIEIAKSLGTPESARFVNGILDSIRLTLHRDPHSAGSTPAT